MTSDLIVVGASVRAAAQSALRAGFRPYAIDQFADRDLKAVCPAVKIRRWPQELLPALAEAPQSPWIYTGGLENHPRLVDRMAALRPLWGNPGSVLARVRNPWQLAAAVREAGLEMPPIAREIPEPVAKGAWLQKPLRSSGGHKIATANSGRRRRGYYYQALMRGQSLGAVYLAANGGCRLLGVSRQLQRPGTFTYQGSLLAPGDRSHESELAPLGLLLAERFALRGLFNVDFIVSDMGIWPLEVNPRYSASVELLERATGVSLLRLHAGACQGAATDAEFPPLPPPAVALGKCIVYAPARGVVTPLVDQLAAKWNAIAQRPQIADLPAIGETIEAGHPVCTVFAEGATIGQVERLLHDRVQRVLEVALASGN